MAERADGPSAPLTLSDKLDRLFKTVKPAKGEYTHEEVATAIEKAGGPTISATYVWQLRKGLRDNPTKHHLEALATFFGVSPSYFFDEEAARAIDDELALLMALRDASVKSIALRAVGLSEVSLDAVRTILDQARAIEGLEPETQEKRKTRKR